MVVAGSTTGQLGAIFPELGAISIGLWCFRIPTWQHHHWHLFWFPSAAAMAGVALRRWSGWSRGPEEMVIGTVVVVVLAAFDSPAAPALSAGMLPVVLGVSSLLYPLTVVLSTALVVGVSALVSRPADREHHDDAHRARTTTRRTWLWPMAGWYLVIVWIVVGVAAVTKVPLLAVPPLFVAAFDQLGSRVRGRTGRQRALASAVRQMVLVETAAALAVGAGVACGSRVDGALFALVVMAVFAVWQRIELMPLFPLCILPVLLPAGQLGTYLWAVPAEAALVGLLVVMVPRPGEHVAGR